MPTKPEQSQLIWYPDTELCAIPSIHCDVVFADMVIQAFRTHKFDVLALELPCNIDPAKLRAAVANLWPMPGVAVLRGVPIGQKRLPISNTPECEETKLKSIARTSCIPLVPCDSLIAAIAMSFLSAGSERGPELAFVDLPMQPGESARHTHRHLPDTWLAARRGLPAYLTSVADRCDDGRLPEIDSAREYAMAARLRQYIEAKKKILFVCGLAHWNRIAALLDAGPRSISKLPDHNETCDDIEIFSIQAPQAWFLGWMGIPAIVADFVRHLARKDTAAFDIPAAVEKLKRRALEQASRHEDQAISVRAALTFEQYLSARLALAGRWTPELDSDLQHSAKCCVSEQWAVTLKKLALSYPFKQPRDTPALKQAEVIQHEGLTYLVTGKQACLLDRRNSQDKTGETRSLPVQPRPLSGKERLKAGLLPCIRSIPAEDRFQKALMSHAWLCGAHFSQLTRPPNIPTRTVRFSGDMGKGIDWRRTMRAWAEGFPESTFHVRLPARRHRGGMNRSKEGGLPTQCPVAWICSPHAAVSSKASACYPPSGVKSSFYWLRETVTMQGGITRETVAYAVNVLRGRTASWDEESVRKLLQSLPKSQQPRVSPWCDYELREFTGPDLAIAAAIKYSDRRAIVVADCSFPLSLSLQAYARRRGVEIVKLAWDSFGEEARRRLALQHTAPSKTPYADPPAYVLRLIPPVPKFAPRIPIDVSRHYK